MYGYFGQYPPNKITRIIYFLPNFVKLFWKLFRDPRVHWYNKAIPIIGGIIALSYLIFPIDVLPDYIAFIGQLDDLTVVLLFMVPSLWIFIRGCPKSLVKEYAQQIGNRSHF